MYQKICLWLYWLCAILANTLQDMGLLFAVLSILMFGDSFLWVLKHLRVETFSSKDLKRWVIAKVTLVWVLFLTQLVINTTGYEANRFINTALSRVIGAELVSIYQNWLVVKTGEAVRETDVLTGAIRAILAKIRDLYKPL